jgi:hypothetical protein
MRINTCMVEVMQSMLSLRSKLQSMEFDGSEFGKFIRVEVDWDLE